MVTAEGRGTRKLRMGRVVSSSGDKTIVVAVERLMAHPRYHRRIKRTKKIMAHDEDNTCRVGDLVRVMETRPLSRRKRWRVVEVVERAK